MEENRHLSRHPAEDKHIFAESYKNTVFYMWYLFGKPNANKLLTVIESDETGGFPSPRTAAYWIKEFADRATELDTRIERKLEETTIKEKVEMLNRHAERAEEMQQMAIDYLRENKDKLNPHSAVRLWVEGIKIERESRGLPSLITEISKSSNEELESMINKILSEVDTVEAVEELPEDVDQE